MIVPAAIKLLVATLKRGQTHMGKKKLGKLARAVEAFGELPPELSEFGKPLSIHPLSRLGDGISNPSVNRLAGYIVAGVLIVCSCVALVPYFNKSPFGRAPYIGWLAVAIAAFVFAIASAVAGWIAGRVPSSAAENGVRGLIIFPDAIVEMRYVSCSIIRWVDVKVLYAPAAKKVWTVVSKDGREIPLPSWVANESDAIINLCKSVSAHFLPKYLAMLEAGKRVMFGEFGVSKRYVYSKEEKLAWEEVTKLEVVNGRLHVRRGGLLPWADYALFAEPNGFLAGELVRRLAPPRLLISGTGNREW
jgi:hypothetical protein